MDSFGKSREARIKRADDDPAVLGRGIMEANEMAAVHRQHGPPVFGCKPQDFLIRPRLAGMS